MIKDHCNIGLAFDNKYCAFYSPGIIEARKQKRLIHIDGARQTGALHPINELSVVLYLQAPEQGGELQIFNKEQEESDDYQKVNFRFKNSDVFLNKICQKYDSIVIKPNAGDMIIFANCYYHQVLASQGLKYRIAYLTSIYSVNSRLTIFV